MEKKVLWGFLVALLLLDVMLILQRGKTEKNLVSLQASAGNAMLESAYADEEQQLLSPSAGPSSDLLDLLTAEGIAGGEGLALLLVASVNDCTNCIEDEIVKLNRLVAKRSSRLTGVLGYFVDEDRTAVAERFLMNLTPTPRFPMAIEDVRPRLPGMSTPLVLVIASQDGRILDAHKPIPENLSKRDAFYHRWQWQLDAR